MGRLFAASDIHAHGWVLEKLLEKAGYDPKEDQLVLLGDYIDRGPQAVPTVELIKKLVAGGAVALKGNHEVMLWACLTGRLDLDNYVANGGGQTLESYKALGEEKADEVLADHIEFLLNLPSYHETDGFVFAHAGLHPFQPPAKQSDIEYLWIREVMLKSLGIKKNWWDIDNTYLYKAGKKLVFGHTPVQYLHWDKRYGDIWFGREYIGIDTGIHTPEGCLTLMDLTNMIAYQGKSNGSTAIGNYEGMTKKDA